MLDIAFPIEELLEAAWAARRGDIRLSFRQGHARLSLGGQRIIQWSSQASEAMRGFAESRAELAPLFKPGLPRPIQSTLALRVAGELRRYRCNGVRGNEDAAGGAWIQIDWTLIPSQHSSSKTMDLLASRGLIHFHGGKVLSGPSPISGPAPLASLPEPPPAAASPRAIDPANVAAWLAARHDLRELSSGVQPSSTPGLLALAPTRL